MQLNLLPHPAALPSKPDFKVWANVDHAGAFGATATTNIWFGVGAPTSRFIIPEAEESSRVDGLLKTTCFEVFLRETGSDSYQEWNFAPSGQWAAYDFSDYREGMTELEVGAPPYIRMEDNLIWWTLGATMAVQSGKKWDLGLSAVLEETDGTRSYWALAHSSEKPDFHAPDCFAAKLP
jgi:hypothetical protein